MNNTDLCCRYVTITPVRDEEAYLGLTLESVVSQTIHPSEWVIVKDGSTDNTGGSLTNMPNSIPGFTLFIGRTADIERPAEGDSRRAWRLWLLGVALFQYGRVQGASY